MGKVRIFVYFKSGSVESRDVASVMGIDYIGEYLILHEAKDGLTTSYPYCLRDVNYFTRESIETVH